MFAPRDLMGTAFWESIAHGKAEIGADIEVRSAQRH